MWENIELSLSALSVLLVNFDVKSKTMSSSEEFTPEVDGGNPTLIVSFRDIGAG